MNNPLEQLMQQTGMGNSFFTPASRYFGLEIRMIKGPDGHDVNYVSRRIIPRPEEYQVLEEHQVVQNDRLDNIANQYLGDPEQFWQICDANAAMNPLELTENPGESILITLPQGIKQS